MKKKPFILIVCALFGVVGCLPEDDGPPALQKFGKGLPAPLEQTQNKDPDTPQPKATNPTQKTKISSKKTKSTNNIKPSVHCQCVQENHPGQPLGLLKEKFRNLLPYSLEDDASLLAILDGQDPLDSKNALTLEKAKSSARTSRGYPLIYQPDDNGNIETWISLGDSQSKDAVSGLKVDSIKSPIALSSNHCAPHIYWGELAPPVAKDLYLLNSESFTSHYFVQSRTSAKGSQLQPVVPDEIPLEGMLSSCVWSDLLEAHKHESLTWALFQFEWHKNPGTKIGFYATDKQAHGSIKKISLSKESQGQKKIIFEYARVSQEAKAHTCEMPIDENSITCKSSSGAPTIFNLYIEPIPNPNPNTNIPLLIGYQSNGEDDSYYLLGIPMLRHHEPDKPLS